MKTLLKSALLLSAFVTSAFSGGIWSSPAKITKLQVLATSYAPGSAVSATPICLVELNGNTYTTYLFELNGQIANMSMFDLLLSAKASKADVQLWYDPAITLSANTQTANGVLERPQLIAASFNPNP
jgi:hypothetical protein